ncbi:MAG: MFS transporter [Bacteroidales bacterium]|nr:MFS transporter [Bacteroidales bacterium]
MTIFKKQNYKWEVLLLLWGAFLLNQADRQVFNTVLPAMRDALGLTDTSVGMIATLFNLFYAFLVPVGGWAGDHLSKKWVTTLSILFWSVATMFTGLATGFVWLVVLRSVATGGGEAFFGPANYSMIAEYHTDTRARAMSVHQTAYYVGVIMAGWLAGFIADRFGWQYSFIIFGAAGVLWAFLMVIRLKDRQDAPEEKPVSEVQQKPGFFEGFKVVFTTPTALMLTVGFSGLIFVLTGYLSWMPTYLHENFGQSLAAAGFNAVFYTHLAAFAGVLAAGSLSDRLGRRNPRARMVLQAAGLLAGVPFLLMFGACNAVWLVYLGLAGFGFCRAFFDANTYTVLYDVTPSRLHASCSSVMIMIGFGVGALAPVILGSIKQSAGLDFAFVCLAAVWLVCGLMMLAVALKRYRTDYDNVRKG